MVQFPVFYELFRLKMIQRTIRLRITKNSMFTEYLKYQRVSYLPINCNPMTNTVNTISICTEARRVTRTEKILIHVHFILIRSHLQHCFQLSTPLLNIEINKVYGNVQGMVRSIGEKSLK